MVQNTRIERVGEVQLHKAPEQVVRPFAGQYSTKNNSGRRSDIRVDPGEALAHEYYCRRNDTPPKASTVLLWQ
jgi:hypothetical protein